VYPYGLGVRQRATDQLVVQIHYNLFDETKRGQSDSTTVRFRYADSVARRAIFVLKDAFIEAGARGMAASLPPGLAVAPYSWKSSGAQLGVPPGPGLELVGVMPHMHTRGLRKQMTLTGPDGVAHCAAKVDRWDFNWQKFYFYKGALPRITSDTQLQLTCEYTTLADRMPVLPGWGTRNEMCIAILMLALPPAPDHAVLVSRVHHGAPGLSMGGSVCVPSSRHAWGDLHGVPPPPPPASPSRPVTLPADEVVRRLSELLFRAPPDAALIARARSMSLATSAGVAELARTMLRESAGGERRGRVRAPLARARGAAARREGHGRPPRVEHGTRGGHGRGGAPVSCATWSSRATGASPASSRCRWRSPTSGWRRSMGWGTSVVRSCARSLTTASCARACSGCRV
jgi:hypothetical protein